MRVVSEGGEDTVSVGKGPTCKLKLAKHGSAGDSIEDVGHRLAAGLHDVCAEDVGEADILPSMW